MMLMALLAAAAQVVAAVPSTAPARSTAPGPSTAPAPSRAPVPSTAIGAATATATTPSFVAAGSERATWYACLEDYAQVAMSSTGTPVTIALQTDEACEAERKAFRIALLRSRTVEGDGNALVARFGAEDRAAYEHVIRFVERLR